MQQTVIEGMLCAGIALGKIIPGLEKEIEFIMKNIFRSIENGKMISRQKCIKHML